MIFFKKKYFSTSYHKFLFKQVTNEIVLVKNQEDCRIKTKFAAKTTAFEPFDNRN
jgi:hypothetical protein